ncbi:type VI secretion system protein TssL, short form [Xanthomonas sp. WHRI 1810A]|uniref:type VI secretion system protein TssL, short form n=1 Tax=Xanthomonas sp. WHRI 1810A TaxID=3161565 RepID=UPI0032E8BA82
MTPIGTQRTAASVDIDALLQDTYLLVVELRNGASLQDGIAVWTLCVRQVEHVRQQLKSAGLSQRNIDYISHAQCALLDETVLSCAAHDARQKWAGESLQVKFFGRHQAGDFVYEEMREVLRAPAPNLQVLTVFQRILMLGFCGRYADRNNPERQQLLHALNAQVAPFEPGQGVTTQVGQGARMHYLRWLRSPVVHGVTVSLLLVSAWWALDRLLGGLVTMLLPGLT